MEELAMARISVESGLEGDSKGAKFPLRQITILAREDWEAALQELGNPELPWTTRRANFLIEGMRLPRGAGSEITIGDAILEVTAQTTPCSLMDRAHAGLRRALAPDWRGGVTCKVRVGGAVGVGATVMATRVVAARKVHLPG